MSGPKLLHFGVLPGVPGVSQLTNDKVVVPVGVHARQDSSLMCKGAYGLSRNMNVTSE